MDKIKVKRVGADFTGEIFKCVELVDGVPPFLIKSYGKFFAEFGDGSVSQLPLEIIEVASE